MSRINQMPLYSQKKSLSNKLGFSQAPVRRSGFTLIELLVVISIIGFLSTIAIFSTQQIRAKTRDMKRVHDIQQIAKAINFYYLENNNFMETPTTASLSDNCPECIAAWINIEGILSPYIKKLPRDPNPYCGDNAWNYTIGSFYLNGEYHVSFSFRYEQTSSQLKRPENWMCFDTESGCFNYCFFTIILD